MHDLERVTWELAYVESKVIETTIRLSSNPAKNKRIAGIANKVSGKFMGVKQDGKPFEGVRKDK
jgi:hypothetical protein